MASEPDDNPFARNSVWPKMPQAPLRIRNLPPVGSLEPEPPRPITPLVVLPMPAPPAAAISTGGGVPRSSFVKAPEGAVEPDLAPETLEPPAADDAVRDAPLDVLVAPPPPARHHRSPPSRLPVVAATLVGLAGLAGLALLLSRGREPSLPPPPVVEASPPPVAEAQAPPSQAQDIPPSAPIQSPALVAPVAPTPATRAPRVERPPSTPSARMSASVAQTSDMSRATTEALDGEALILPMAPSSPTYRPPAVADPAAPIVTRDPNS